MIRGMIGDDLHILLENVLCLTILQAYEEVEHSQGDIPDSCWRERVSERAEQQETETPAWSNAHGLLIAYGFLDIELQGRATGIQYRITQEGKRMLARLDGVLPDMIEENFEEPGEFLDEAEDLAA